MITRYEGLGTVIVQGKTASLRGNAAGQFDVLKSVANKCDNEARKQKSLSLISWPFANTRYASPHCR